ncbi:unnamed protein product [Orchesella dallaii]|uniref:Uncharacterized protein n=1 Tax=Orchesella dallaii TaxID=48710 RepID=A0ABP1S2R1_9HEXA
MQSQPTPVPIERYSDNSIHFIVFPTTINETVEKITETGKWHLEDATFFLVSKGNEHWIGEFLQLIDSLEYPGFIAKFVLVLFSSEDWNSGFPPRYSLGLLCFLCKLPEKIMWLPEFEPTISVFPSYRSLTQINSLANNWNGLAQSVYVDWYSLNHPPKNCEIPAYFSMQEANGKCKDWSIILDIVFTKLNITREVGESSFGSDLPSGPPRLRVCIFCSYPAEKSFTQLGIRGVLLSFIREKLYYCEERTTLENIKWNFFLLPDSKTIWGHFPTLEDLKQIVKRKGVSMLAEKYAKVVFNKKSFLSKQTQKLLHRVFPSGLYEFWGSITVMHMVYGSGFNKQNCDGECESGFKKLSMSSPAIIAFYMLGIFLGCAFLVLCGEKISAFKY